MNNEFKDFNRLDPKLFRAFLAAAKWENFTLAATKAAMTQSGVSQQVAKLEEQVGLPLFRRVNKKVSLTSTGIVLQKYIDHYLDNVDSFFEQIALERELKGQVVYAMPNSCLLSPHLGMMLDKRKEFPNIELAISITPNQDVYERVLNGQANFGFVTEFIPNTALNFVPFCQEEYVLIGNRDFQKKSLSVDEINKLPFITYPGMESYFQVWAKTFFPRSRSLNHTDLDVKAHISQLDGVLTLLKGSVGVSVLPKHCAQEFLDQKDLYIIKKGLPKKSVMNDIFMINLKDSPLNRRSQKVFDWFLEMKSL